MSEPTPFATLGPLLLARKGAATPALRNSSQDNDTAPLDADQAAFVDEESLRAEPEVKRQQNALVSRIADSNQVAAERPKAVPTAKKSAQSSGRRAAFTLRLDDERHLKLKLAATLKGASAQHLVTRALDKYLAEMPEIESLAAQIKRDGSKA